MKTLLSLLTIVACTALASAQGLPGIGGSTATMPYTAEICFDAKRPVSYSYVTDETTGAISYPEPLAEGEVFRVLIVRDKRDDVTATTKPSVSIDPAGQIVLDENAYEAVWCKLQVNNTDQDMLTVGARIPGVPNQLMYGSAIGADDAFYGFTTYIGKDDSVTTLGTEGYIYRYVVAFDTRMGGGACGDFVARYAMTLTPAPDGSVGYINKFKDSKASYDLYALADNEEASTYITYANAPGYDLGWQSVAEYTSLVVTQNGVETTLTGDNLMAYLTPNVTTLTATADALSLGVNAPDVRYYTLYTKAALSETTWTPFEEFVTESEKNVDKTIGKRYTRFRIDGKSLSIPVISGEVSRFYQLRGE